MSVTDRAILETFSQDGYTVSLIGYAAAGEETAYEVCCTYGGDTETSACDDYAKAHAHYRTVVRQAFGVNLPYKAPVAVYAPAAPAELTAIDVMFAYLTEIKAAGPGTPAMREILQAMAADPSVELFAEEMLETMTSTTGWVAGSMRQVLRDLLKARKMRQDAVIAQNPNYGRF
ncbi:MAG: hypothetical protein DI537_14005 [Stutzerimonas stutzeri]|nr:MAG: hypothetical protein DI537_14005 [Stutzerimonas stutzeri]